MRINTFLLLKDGTWLRGEPIEHAVVELHLYANYRQQPPEPLRRKAGRPPKENPPIVPVDAQTRFIKLAAEGTIAFYAEDGVGVHETVQDPVMVEEATEDEEG